MLRQLDHCDNFQEDRNRVDYETFFLLQSDFDDGQQRRWPAHLRDPVPALPVGPDNPGLLLPRLAEMLQKYIVSDCGLAGR